MSKNNRIFRIIKMILLMRETYVGWNAQKFADYFNVSVRTFHRDKGLMEELGVPIYYDNQCHSYKILDTFNFEAPNLTKEETESLMFAAKEYHNKNVPFSAELETAMAKIHNTLPDFIKNSISKYIKQYKIIDKRYVDLGVHEDTLNKINQAMEEQESIVIDYYALSKDRKSKRKVEPYNIFFNDGAPYLAGYCHLRDEIRYFRIDRINEITLTNEKYQIPDDYSLEDNLADAWGIEQGENIYVKVRFIGKAARLVKEYHWNERQHINEISDKEIIFSVWTSSREEIKSWILSYGASAQVLAPTDLREEIRVEIGKMLNNY